MLINVVNNRAGGSSDAGNITYSKSTIETLEKGVKHAHS